MTFNHLQGFGKDNEKENGRKRGWMRKREGE
jgi:hypothetical protein